MNYASPFGGVHTPSHSSLLFSNQSGGRRTSYEKRTSSPQRGHAPPPPPHTPLVPSQAQHDEQLASMALYLKNYYGQDDDEVAKDLVSMTSDDVLSLAQCFYLDLFRLLRDQRLFQESEGRRASDNTYLYEPTPQHVGVPIYGGSPAYQAPPPPAPYQYQPVQQFIPYPVMVAPPYVPYLPPPPASALPSHYEDRRAAAKLSPKKHSPPRGSATRTTKTSILKIADDDGGNASSSEQSMVSSNTSGEDSDEDSVPPPPPPPATKTKVGFLKGPKNGTQRIVVRRRSVSPTNQPPQPVPAEVEGLKHPEPSLPSAGAKYSDPEWLQKLRSTGAAGQPPPPLAPPPRSQFASLDLKELRQPSQVRYSSVASTAHPPPLPPSYRLGSTPLRSSSVDSRASSPSTRVRTPPPTRKFVSGVPIPSLPPSSAPPMPMSYHSQQLSSSLQMPERYTNRLRTPSSSQTTELPPEAPLQPIRLEPQLERESLGRHTISNVGRWEPLARPVGPPPIQPRRVSVSRSQSQQLSAAPSILSSPIQPLPFAATMPFLKQGSYFIKYASRGGKPQRRYFFVKDYLTAVRRVGGKSEVVGIVEGKELANRAKGNGRYAGLNVTESLVPYLCWTSTATGASDESSGPSERLCLLELMDIIFGSNDNFAKTKDRRKGTEVVGLDGTEVPEEFCFTLIFPSRSVDVAAFDEAQLLTWAGGLLSVLKKNLELRG